MARRDRIGSIAFVVAAVLALVIATPALGALPRTYQVQRIESPNPQQNANFGLGLIGHSDLNGDGEDDFLVPQTATGPNSDGQIFIFSGATGAVIDTINAPDAGNPTNAASGNNRAGFGLFTSTLADLGSCPGGSAGVNCAAPSTTADGVDEIVAGATGVDVPTAGAPGGIAIDSGRAYVIDGRTRAVLKRIDMPVADRLEQATFPAGPPNPHSPSFGRTVLAPAGLPPCAGSRGIGPCDTLPNSVAIGDIDGAFDPDANDLADLVIGAPTYDEQTSSNPACSPGQCHEAGRSYIYRGEDIMNPANGGAAVPLQVPLRTLKSLVAQTDDPVSSAQTNLELFGQAVFPIGDVGRCNAATPAGEACPNASSTSAPDGSPEVVISAFRTDLPSNADFPDPAWFDVGVNMLVDGRTSSVLAIYQHPEPQPGSIFGFTLHNEPAPGDLGSVALPDVLIPAMRQNVDFNAQGRAYVMNGNFKAGANGINFAQLNDPTPGSGGNFGVSSAGVGNLVSDAEGAPRNELLVGAFGPHNPGTNADIINDIHIFNAVTERLLQSIPDPDQQKGSSFGTALAPIGDVNDDGFLDLTVAADLWDAGADAAGRNQGRAYIFRSDNSPGPAQNPPVFTMPPSSGCPAGTATGVSCQPNGSGGLTITGTPGANRIVGSTGRDVIRCGDGDDVVLAGPGNDEIRCGAGNDTIEAGAGDDTVDGESGNDRIDGDPGSDRLLGGTGNDTVAGGSGNDVVGGGAGDDRLSGNEGADRLSGNSGNDRISGNEANDRINGGHNSDRISGNSGNDRISGGRTGNDRLNGGGGSDRLAGGSGRDSLVAGSGRDRLSGGGGNDRLNSRDRSRGDRANCGSGRRDRASIDRGDRVRGCERVRPAG